MPLTVLGKRWLVFDSCPRSVSLRNGGQAAQSEEVKGDCSAGNQSLLPGLLRQKGCACFPWTRCGPQESLRRCGLLSHERWLKR